MKWYLNSEGGNRKRGRPKLRPGSRCSMTIWQKWKLPGMKPNKLRKIAVDGESSSPDIPKTPGGTKSTSMC